MYFLLLRGEPASQTHYIWFEPTNVLINPLIDPPITPAWIVEVNNVSSWTGFTISLSNHPFVGVVKSVLTLTEANINAVIQQTAAWGSNGTIYNSEQWNETQRMKNEVQWTGVQLNISLSHQVYGSFLLYLYNGNPYIRCHLYKGNSPINSFIKMGETHCNTRVVLEGIDACQIEWYSRKTKHQELLWTIADILSIGILWAKSSKIWIEITKPRSRKWMWKYYLKYGAIALRGRLNIKMPYYQYRDPRVKDKTVPRPSYL